MFFFSFFFGSPNDIVLCYRLLAMTALQPNRTLYSTLIPRGVKKTVIFVLFILHAESLTMIAHAKQMYD